MWGVRRSKPNHGQKRVFALGFFRHPLQSGIRSNDRTLALHLNGFALTTEDGIVVVEVGSTQPVIETILSRMSRAGFADGTQMPLAEMRCFVARRFKDFRQGDFLRTHRITPLENSHAVGMPTGQHTGPRGEHTGAAGVKLIEPQTGGAALSKLGVLITGWPLYAISPQP